MANPDAKGSPVPPPNLRVSTDETRECGDCEYYQHGRCTHEGYNMLPVLPEWLCDSFAKGGTDADADEVPAHDLKGASRNALIRVRAHTRAARSSSQQ